MCDREDIFELSCDEASDLNRVNTHRVEEAGSRVTSKVKGQLQSTHSNKENEGEYWNFKTSLKH